MYNQQYRSKKTSNNVSVPLPIYEGKLPPQAPEIEESVLGALMIEKDAFSIVGEILKPESFYDNKNAKIYKAISDLAMAQNPIDMHTVTEQLRKNGDLEEVGGAYTITLLTTKVASAAHIEYHAKIIAQKALARDLIRLSSEVEGKAFSDETDVDELMQEAESKLFEISQRNMKKDVVAIGEVVQDAISRIEYAQKQEGNISGISSGFDDLDKITSGWQRSDLVIIAARPAMGKTAFVLSMAKNMAVDKNIGVGMFSLEMSNVQLVNRVISNVCELEGDKIKNGRLSDDEWHRLDNQIKKLQNAPLYIDDTANLSIFELRTKARRLVREHDVKIIIIDYLQLMNASGMNFGSREQEVSMISRSLKGLAKELDIPILALSQLNRSVENRGFNNENKSDAKRPQLSDLRESGAIEQDADMVCFIHRPEYYKITEDSEGNDLHGIAEIIIAKHRNGSVGDVKLHFRGSITRFENLTQTSFVEVSSKMNSISPLGTSNFDESNMPFSINNNEPMPF